MEKHFDFDERYAEALIHRARGHVIWGVRLLPFSAWHQTVLEYAQSPILAGAEATGRDVRFMLDVCSLSFPKIPSRGSGLWSRLRRGLRDEADMRLGRRTLAETIGAIQDYFTDYVSMPKVIFSGNKGAGGGGKESAVMASGQMPDIDQTLMDVAAYRKYTGCPRNEPWDIPVGELSWMNAAMARMSGANLRVITTLEDEVLERLRKRRGGGGND